MSDGALAISRDQQSATSVSTTARDGLRFAFFIWVMVRICLSVWGAVCVWAVTPSLRAKVVATNRGLVLPERDLHGLTIGLWNIYDTRHYITIAETGYASDPGYLDAFFPGYPLLIKLVSFVFLGDSLLAALVIANLSALVFFWYLYRLVEPDYGAAVARRAVVFGAIFPTSYFLFFGYTEAPLLALTVMALYYGRQQKWWAAGLLAAGAALVKQPGVFVLIPLGYMYWRQFMAHKNAWTIGQKMAWVWLLLIPVAALSYTIYRYLFSGAAFTSATNISADGVLTVPGVPLVRALLALRLDNPYLVQNAIDVAFTLLMIGLTAGAVLKLRSTVYSLYSVLLAVVSLSVTRPDLLRPEVDMPRRVLIIFPIFIFLATVTGSGRRFRWLVVLSVILFLALSALSVNWVFIS